MGAASRVESVHVGRRVRTWHTPVPRQALPIALTVTSLAIIVVCGFLAVVHVDDRYHVDHVSGARMALAQELDRGVLYPPLFDGERYGGTRFMPLPIVLHTALARLTGDYLVSGKLLGYAGMLGLLVTMLVILKRICPLPVALALTVSVLVTRTGLAGSMGLRADVLATLLQLVAASLIAFSPKRTSVIAAGSLAALAFFAKLSAIWAPLAIVVWLVLHGRRRLGWFVGGYALSLAVLFVLFAAVSDGRIFENVFGLGGAGFERIASIQAVLSPPYRLLHLLVDEATMAWVLIPFALVAVWSQVRDGSLSVFALGLVFASIVLVVVMFDAGTGWNQLIDLVVLVALVVGELLGGNVAATHERPLLARVVSTLLVWVLSSALVVMLLPESRAAWAAHRGVDPPSLARNPLSHMITDETILLSEDPYVPLSLGRRPLVLDPFMLIRIGRRGPAVLEPLLARIEAREFDLVVLKTSLSAENQEWFERFHLGDAVAEALSRNYALAGQEQGYYLYRPAVAASGPA